MFNQLNQWCEVFSTNSRRKCLANTEGLIFSQYLSKELPHGEQRMVSFHLISKGLLRTSTRFAIWEVLGRLSKHGRNGFSKCATDGIRVAMNKNSLSINGPFLLRDITKPPVLQNPRPFFVDLFSARWSLLCFKRNQIWDTCIYYSSSLYFLLHVI